MCTLCSFDTVHSMQAATLQSMLLDLVSTMVGVESECPIGNYAFFPTINTAPQITWESVALSLNSRSRFLNSMDTQQATVAGPQKWSKSVLHVDLLDLWNCPIRALPA